MAFYFSPSKHHPLVSAQSLSRPRYENASSALSLSQWSSDLELDANQEWVVFSPQLLSSREGEEDYATDNNSIIDNEIRPILDLHNTISLKSGDEDEGDQELEQHEQQLEQELEQEQDITPDGALTPLAFPTHNGSGMFLEASDLTDRVNAWRLNQSQLVLQEMKRLERKFFHSNSNVWVGGGGASTSTVQPDVLNQSLFTNSGIESFGLNGSDQPITQESNINNLKHENESNQKPPSSLWATLRDFIGINDEVLEVIFGERLINEDEDDTTTQSTIENTSNSPPPSSEQHSHSHSYTHYNQAQISGPLNWESNMITSLFKELHIPLPPEISFLRYLGSQLLAFTHPDLVYTNPTTIRPPNHNHRNHHSTFSNTYSFRSFSTHTDSIDRTFPANYWEDSVVSSNYWEQGSSVSSTPVW